MTGRRDWDSLYATAMNRPNHLIKEKSPYLLQHAHNPVDWRPWGEEAFAKARRENKPILLSIGYSTCHWCHVMEHESFENEATARIMNQHFVSIKLDREERPDVDKIYMTAVQAMTGSGGWPLNVFLTTDLKPFFGGTYFPPEARWGQPGFPDLLKRVAELWETRQDALQADSSKLTQSLRAHLAREPHPGPAGAIGAAIFDRAFESYRGSFDEAAGGFGGAPKFPMPVNINFLLRYWSSHGKKEALAMCLESLRAMACGGVYDQVGGGFHRYSTDAQWRVPHFEKMLYDNAQIAVNFIEAYQASQDPFFASIARETLDYVRRDMTHPDGGFFSAEDADSLAEGATRKAEGAFYLWSHAELQNALGPDAEIAIYRYDAEPDGNAPADPHGEFTGRNILYARRTIEETARHFKRKEPEIQASLVRSRARLLQIRAARSRPGLDDKVLTSWNGLMISAFAKAGPALEEPQYVSTAEKAASFVRERLYDAKTGRLYHRWRDGERAVAGIADDCAFLAQGLLDLYEATFDAQWLDWAEALTDAQLELFSAKEGGFYMTAEDHDPNLLMRVMEDTDNVEPCASSVSALNLQRLAQMTGRESYRRFADATLSRFKSQLSERPLAMPQMLAAADFNASQVRQIIIAAENPDAADVRAMRRELAARFLPTAITLFADKAFIAKRGTAMPFIKTMKPIGGKATAYVCVNFSCKLPTNDPKILRKKLEDR